jgi:hypothetical protein
MFRFPILAIWVNMGVFLALQNVVAVPQYETFAFGFAI